MTKRIQDIGRLVDAGVSLDMEWIYHLERSVGDV